MHDVLFCRPANYDVYLHDIFKQRLCVELQQPNPLESQTFFQLSCHKRVQLLQLLCDFRLDADDVSEVLKVGDEEHCLVVLFTFFHVNFLPFPCFWLFVVSLCICVLLGLLTVFLLNFCHFVLTS